MTTFEHLWRDPSAGAYRAQGWWRDELLTDVVRRWAASRPNDCAIIDGTVRLDWRQLTQRVSAAALALQRAGVAGGDVVSTQLPNGVDIVVMHLAVEALGAVHNPLAVQLREHELDQIGGLLKPRIVVFPDDTSVDYRAIHSRTAVGKTGRALPIGELKGDGGEGLPTDRWIKSAASDPAFILNTSGTIAMKGVVHTHEDAMYSTRVVGNELLGLGQEDTILCVIPMTWGGGLEWGLRIAMHTGARLVIAPRWNPGAAADLIDRENVNYLYGPPTIAGDLVAMASDWRPQQAVSMICAGAPIPRQVARDARELLGISLLPGYGQTEHFHSTLARPDDTFERITTSDGAALPGVEVRAVSSASGDPVGPGEEGELQCRGPNVGAGYWNQPDLTERIFRGDGWQVTQDIGRLDADGYLRVSGRKRDIIIRGGLNVSPREVEELVTRHPDVREAAVIGIPDQRYGERICVFVVPAGGHAPGVAELSASLAELGVARYKHPEEVRTIDALPLTTTGKVRHQALRDALAEERDASGTDPSDPASTA